MKKLFIQFLLLLALIILGSCSQSITVPNLINTNEETAESIIANLSLIPTIEYEYSDSIEEGKVTRTSPEFDTEVDELSNVIIFVSLGPSLIYAKNSTIEWYHVENSTGDDYRFDKPRIEEGILIVDIEVTFNSTSLLRWRDDYNNGFSFGTASVVDTFDKTVPITIEYEELNIISGSSQNVVLRVPLEDLDVNKPTTLYTKWVIQLDLNENYQVRVNFTISW